MKSADTVRRPPAIAAPTVGWASLSAAALLVVFRPDAAAFYLPLVLLALIASIVCFAGRRLGHGLTLLACVLLMPAVIAESIVYWELAKPVAPPTSAARQDRRGAASQGGVDASETFATVNFLDAAQPTVAPRESACRDHSTRDGTARAAAACTSTKR